MRQAGLVGCHRRRPFQTTRRDPAAEPAPDLVQRTFAASAPNVLWIADITYVPTQDEGFLYLAVILDVFSRRVVGWSMAEHLRTELVVGALEMAVWNRRPGEGVIHHSDHGCPYTVHLAALRRTLPGGGHPLLDGIGRRLFR
jgi:putative transposase